MMIDGPSGPVFVRCAVRSARVVVLASSLLGCGDEPVAPTGSGAGGSGGGTSTTSTTSAASGGAGGAEGGTTSSTEPAGGAGGSGGAGGGTAVTILNPGFEEDPVAAGDYDDQIVPAGWVKYDPQGIIGLDYNSLGVLNPTGTGLYPGGAPQGSNVALVFLWRMQTDGIPAGYSQELAHALLPGTHYTLRVEVGNIADLGGASYSLDGFPGYRVELLAGGAVIAMDDDTLAPPEGQFEESVVEVTTPMSGPEIGLPVSIRLLNLNKASSGIEVNFDDVRLEAAPAGG